MRTRIALARQFHPFCPVRMLWFLRSVSAGRFSHQARGREGGRACGGVSGEACEHARTRTPCVRTRRTRAAAAFAVKAPHRGASWRPRCRRGTAGGRLAAGA
eukprot:690291-Pleurochrysis_carterae.AAC.1